MALEEFKCKDVSRALRADPVDSLRGIRRRLEAVNSADCWLSGEQQAD